MGQDQEHDPDASATAGDEDVDLAVDVVRNEAARRWEAKVDGHLAVLTYALADGRLRLLHTGVPEEIGDRGIGGALVRAAMDWADAQDGVRVVPSCSFARAWIADHDEYAHLVEESAGAG